MGQVCCYGYQTGSTCAHIIKRAAYYGLGFEDARGLCLLLRRVGPLVVVARHDGSLLSYLDTSTVITRGPDGQACTAHLYSL